MVGDDAKILQSDVGVAVPTQFLGEIPLGPEGAVCAVHPDFVIFGSANERFRIHPFLQHQPVTEVHAVDSLVDAQHHASHRLSVRGFARLVVSAYSKPNSPNQTPISAQWAKERNVPWPIVCVLQSATRPVGIGPRPDWGFGMIVAGWAGSVDRLRLVRLVVEEVEVGSLLMQRGIGDGDADHGVSEQLVVPVVEAAALAPCGELGFGHALV